MTKNKTYEIDMTSGNLFIKMVKFSLPLILTGVLQLLYNAADLLVVSNFSGDKEALAAVGSTGSIINLIVNLFMGLSVGTNVLVARMFSTKNEEGMKKVVHTSVLVSVLSGLILGLIGILISKPLLHAMNNDLELSNIYVKIYFLGLPFNMLYNFSSAILRGVGDTKRPLIFLTISGLINVLLNLFFVIVLKLSVAGVALATIISQAISSLLMMNCLIKTKESYHFSFKELKISKKELLEIIKIGLPAGLQSSVFSLANVVIQSGVNSYGTAAMGGNSATQNIEGFVYTAMNSVYHASLSFSSQNYGIKNTKNILKTLLYSLIIVVCIWAMMGIPIFLFGEKILAFYTKDPYEIEVGYIRLHYLCLPYFLCGIMDVTCGVIRGLGYSITPMIVSLLGACGTRLIWIYTVFKPITNPITSLITSTTDPSTIDYSGLRLLYFSYPLSWIITFTVHIICFIVFFKKAKRILDIKAELD